MIESIMVKNKEIINNGSVFIRTAKISEEMNFLINTLNPIPADDDPKETAFPNSNTTANRTATEGIKNTLFRIISFPVTDIPSPVPAVPAENPQNSELYWMPPHKTAE